MAKSRKKRKKKGLRTRWQRFCEFANSQFASQVFGALLTSGIIAFAAFLYANYIDKPKERTRRQNEIVTELRYRLDKARALLADETVANPGHSARVILDSDNLLPRFDGWKMQALLYEFDDACLYWPDKASHERIESLKKKFPFDEKPQVAKQVNDLIEVLDKLN